MAAPPDVIYPGIFVTGTGTGVGKTIVSASVVHALHMRGIAAAAIKPFATGVTDESSWQDDDAKLLAAVSKLPLDVVSPYRFPDPVAPLTAARAQGMRIDVDGALRSVRELIASHPFTVVEGVGGAAVPLTPTTLVSDFAAALRLPVLIVSRTDLGTINHTLLTIDHLRSRDCEILGVIFTHHSPTDADMAQLTGPAVVSEISYIERFGVIPYCPALRGDADLHTATSGLPWRSEALKALTTSLFAES